MVWPRAGRPHCCNLRLGSCGSLAVGHDHSDNPAAAEAQVRMGSSFALMCPTCRYDLRGLPDGACPECGRSFVRAHLEAELRRVWAERLARRRISPDWILAAMALPCLLALPVVITGSPRDQLAASFWTLLLWSITLYWAWRGRWVIFGPSGIRLLWFSVPTVYTALFLMHTRDAVAEGLAILAVGAAGVLLSWFCAPPRKLWLGLGLLSAVFLVPAGTFALNACWRFSQGLTWSGIADVRAGQVHLQYPLRNDEVLLTGAIGAIPGLMLAGLATYLWLRSRAKVNPRSSSDSK